MDKELIELCKEVYKRTEWVMPNSSHNRYVGIRGSDFCPLYTSDYLLEKLPNQHNNGILMLSVTNATKWGAEYYSFYPPERGAKTEVYIADTPLKALLKLVIALADAGVKL